MPRTKLFVCELLLGEALAVVALEELIDVDVIPYSSGIKSSDDPIRSLSTLVEGTNDSEAICVVGSEWVTSLRSLKHTVRSAHFIEAGNSYELIAGKTLTDRLLDQGSYIIYPGTLSRWKELLAPFDLNNPQDIDCFKRSMKRIVLLDTDIGSKNEKALADMTALLDLPSDVVNVGLDIFRLNISKGVLAARLNKENESNMLVGQTEARIRADYAMAFDLLQEMSQESDENKVIDSIMNIMTLLFAPESREYYSIDDDGKICRSIGDGTEDQEAIGRGGPQSISNGYDESINGFRLRIENKGRTLGVVVVRAMAFPEYWRQYISLGMQMAPVFGLAIANARHFKGLEESERKVEHALNMEKATLDISKFFIGQVLIEKAIPGALERIGVATGSDRAAFFQIVNGYSEMVITHEWSSDPSFPRITGSIRVSDQRWLMDRLSGDDVVFIEDADGLPQDANKQLAQFEKVKIRSMIASAIQVDGHVSGFLCLQDLKGPRKWEEDQVRMLRFLGQTVSMTMQERKTQMDVTKENESLIITHKVLTHDIKNELMVVNGSLELLAIDQDRKHMDRAISSTAKITEMIEQFKQLDAFLLSGKGLFPCKLADIIETVMASHHIQYRIEGDAMVMADFALASVMENLVNNARRHGMAERLLFEIRSKDLSVELSVADDGIGIPVEIRDKIFREGFSYGHNKSTGLGLFLIRRTMERYSGQIAVGENRPRGTKFILSFPRRGQAVVTAVK